MQGGDLGTELGGGGVRVGFDQPGTSRAQTDAYFNPRVERVAPVNPGQLATHWKFPDNSYTVPDTYRTPYINPTLLSPDIWNYSYYNPPPMQGPAPYIPIGPGDPGWYPEPGEEGYGVLRENAQTSDLKDAIREAIKLKVSTSEEAHHGGCDACETCGEMHGPEEPCELPTLEEAIRQAILRKIGKKVKDR
tara:strand:- start:2463 stop:3035 length:573 start_codon:yes stop_codon:yes gene_type:complete